MNFKFNNKKITGILTVLPANESRFDDEAANNYGLTPQAAARYKKTIGVDRHRVAPPGVCCSDLCVYGLEHLFAEGILKPEEIGAIIFASQTPDYVFPPTSNIIQGRLKLGDDVFCLDLNQGCAGFVIGLSQAFMVLGMGELKKVVLLNAEMSTRQHSPLNRASYPLAGDGASITIIENAVGADVIYGSSKMDGSRGEAIMIPAGAYKTPHSPETTRVVDYGEGVWRSLEQVKMDGNAIFQFTMNEVPKMVDDLLHYAGITDADIDYYMFHQPNRFILENMARKMQIPVSKMPNEMVGIYGNLSSASIPATINHYLGERLLNESFRLCLAGFGVGLTWASMYLRLGNLSVSKIIDYVPATTAAQ